MNIPDKTLTLILAGLVAEGLLVAAHGPRGGYRLARPPSDISLLDIVEAAERPATFDHCVLRDGPRDWGQTCPVHDTWARTQAALTRELASTSLAQMAATDAAIEAGSYQPEAPPHTRLTIHMAPAPSRPPPRVVVSSAAELRLLAPLFIDPLALTDVKDSQTSKILLPNLELSQRSIPRSTACASISWRAHRR